jgi:hypothetical protein
MAAIALAAAGADAAAQSQGMASARPQASPPEAPASISAAPPKQLTVGSGGLFQPGLLLQSWFVGDRSSETTTSTFRLRRAEVSLKGEIVPGRVGYGLMIDPAKALEFKDATLAVSNQDPPPSDPSKPESVAAKQPASAVSVLQDFFVTVSTAFVDVSMGQFKAPVSWEGYNSSAKLLFPERAMVSKEYGDKRDLGLRLAKTFRYLGYSAGVFNGQGLNTLDANNDKDVSLRLEVYPTDGLVLAGMVYRSVGEREAGVKDRYEGDLRFERGPLLVQGEYIRAHDLGKAGPAVDAQGFYGALAWTFFGVLQPCIRAGYLDPDVDVDLDPDKSGGKDEATHGEVGINYYLVRHEAKAQLAYTRLQRDDLPADNQVILAGQVSF